jgi:hypothetical protein
MCRHAEQRVDIRLVIIRSDLGPCPALARINRFFMTGLSA